MTPRAALVRWTAAGLHATGLLRPLTRAVGAVARPPAFQILSYHRVNDERDPFFGSLPSPVFERHMRWIAATHRVLPLEVLVERAREARVPPNALAITFDDGYRDNLTHAAPILARLGLPATVFLATGLIGTGEVAWFDRLALAFKLTTAMAVQAPGAGDLPLTTETERLQALQGTLAYLKRRPDDELRRTVDQLVGKLGVTEPTCLKDLMLTWDDVSALAGLGFSIGAHTVTHPILSRVSAQRARAEIEGSRTMIASAWGRPPATFAYPNGGPEDYTESVTRLVREAGFTCAVTTRFGLNTAATSPWELRRGGPWERDLPTFAMKLTGYRILKTAGPVGPPATVATTD